MRSLPPDLAEAAVYGRQLESRHTDGVKVVEIGIVFMRYKLAIAGIALVSVVIASIYALYAPHSYAYTTIVEIGTNGRNELIEPLETIRAKVTEGYIVQAVQDQIKQHPDQQMQCGITVEIPKNSQVLLLRSQETENGERVCAMLHNAVVDRLRSDHSRAQSLLRKGLESQLDLRERSLRILRDQAKLIETQISRLETKKELSVRELVHLASLRLADNQRAQFELMPLVENVRLQLASIRDTRAVVSPMRSMEPTGLGKKTMVLLAGLAGLVLGTIAVILIDSVTKAREEVLRRTRAT